VPGAATGQDLVSAVPKLKELAEIQVEQVAAINSADTTPELWLDLASRVQKVLRDPTITGAVVTHGTNTLEETAYFLTSSSQVPSRLSLSGRKDRHRTHTAMAH
jgi:L-asparaginase